MIVGSTPSEDGTTRTKGDGCLLVLDANGKLVDVWAGPDINGPWGNMAVSDNGTTATLFVSMAGFDVPGPQVRDPATGFPVTVAKATVLRINLSIPDGQKPVITSRTVVANGFGQRADKDVFLIGPTGLVLAPDNTLYVSDALENRVVAIADATTRTTTAGTGREVTKGGLLQRPLALIMAPNGHLLAVNGRNGQVVEIDPVAGKQIYAQWIDANQAQSPPGNGDLFGLAIKPDGKGFLLRRGRSEYDCGGKMSGETTAGPSRRRLFATAGGILAAAGSGFGARSAEAVRKPNADIEAFWGPHQGGIVTPAQSHTYFAAFDLTTDEARRRRQPPASLDQRRRSVDPGQADRTGQIGSGLRPGSGHPDAR